jgi:hypothetical protein
MFLGPKNLSQNLNALTNSETFEDLNNSQRPQTLVPINQEILMKKLIVCCLLVSSSLFAQELTKIKADYRCELAGGGVAFKVAKGTKPARAWQTDVGEDQGLELKVTSFSFSRCPGCFQFTGTLMDSVQVKASISNLVLTYSAFDTESNQWKDLLSNVQCVAVKP